MIMQTSTFSNTHFCALAWNDPVYPSKLPRVIPLQSVSGRGKHAGTHMTETALNGFSKPETEMFTARDIL